MLAGLASIGGFAQGGLGGSFSVSVSPSDVSKTGSTRGSGKTLTTAPVTVTASGGAGGYIYSWARVSGDAGITADDPTAAISTFSAALASDETLTAIFVCTVTSGGVALATDTVTVTLSLIFIDIGAPL